MPDYYDPFFKTTYGKVIAMVVVEHILIGIKFLLMMVIEDVPLWVQFARARSTVCADRQRSKDRTELYLYEHEELNHLVTASLDKTGKTRKKGEVGKDIAEAAIITRFPSSFSFSPISLSALAVLPLLLQLFQQSLIWYLPIASLLMIGIQAYAMKAGALSATDDGCILHNQSRIDHVKLHLPRWLEDSDVQQAEWLNFIMQVLWPNISAAVDAMVKEQAREAVEKVTVMSSGYVSIKLIKVSLGDNSPKISGIRAHRTEESIVRLDVDLIWSTQLSILAQVYEVFDFLSY